MRDVLSSTWGYLQCAIDGDEDERSRSDFFGLNSYSWCGSEADFDTSGYDDLVEQFSNTSVPVFFSEYGCNKVKPRVFNEVQALYGPQMTPVMSGGLIYEYSQEEADYGLVNIEEDGSVKLRVDYENLQRQYSELDIGRLSESAPASGNGNRPPRCTEDVVTYPTFNASFEIPPTPSDAEDYIENGIPDPQNGRLVDVTETEVKQRVEDSEGNPVENLAITLLPDDRSNVPNPTITSSSETGSRPSGTQTGAAAARYGQGAAGGWYLAAVLVTFVFTSALH